MSYVPAEQPPRQATNTRSVSAAPMRRLNVTPGGHLVWTFQSARSDLVDLASVRLEDPGGNVIVGPSFNSLVQVGVGSVEFAYQAVIGPIPLTAANQNCVAYAQLPGEPAEFALEDVQVTAAVAAPSSTDNIGGVGLYASWINSDDVAAALHDYAVTGEDYSSDAFSASEILYEMSGRRFRGVGTTTDRPGGVIPAGWYGNNRDFLVSWWDAGGYWVWPGFDPRYMEPWQFGNKEPMVLSHTPVLDVIEVRIDGVLIDPSTFYLADGHYLYRLAPAMWPWIQRLDQPDGALGTFHIVYRHGSYPPQSGIDAAASLAAELVKAKLGKRTTLPLGTQQMIRQGVTITKEAMREFRQQGFGLPLVDLFLDAFKIRDGGATVWSPDLPQEGPYLGS